MKYPFKFDPIEYKHHKAFLRSRRARYAQRVVNDSSAYTMQHGAHLAFHWLFYEKNAEGKWYWAGSMETRTFTSAKRARGRVAKEWRERGVAVRFSRIVRVLYVPQA